MTNLLFGFQGRTNRAKFWLVAIALLVIEVIVLGIIGGNAAMSDDPQQAVAALGPVAGIVLVIVGLAATWITIAVGIKRFHDRNKSGVWVLIIFVPVIGSLWYLIECGFLRGTPGPNDYGPDPLAAL
ncbi:MAG TPA: DUF805 domain-containing protein [Reyranella sp.]|jgi:uncharacterized membrane protein YhaH (DUF805 family)|nr:DUF805 domain-containing protein [Reyranella sp.]